MTARTRHGRAPRRLILALVVLVAIAVVAVALLASGALRGTPQIGRDLPRWQELSTRWGTYLSEREWGTPREAVNGNPWGLDYLRAIRQDYRFSDDGIAGWTDESNEFRIGWAFWDGVAPRVNERFFGFGNPTGEHGETILDDRVFAENSPTHAYARMTVRYPLREPHFSVVLEGAKAREGELVLRATVTPLDDTTRSLDVVLKGWLRPGELVDRTPRGLVLRGTNGSVAIAGPEPASWQVASEKRSLDTDLRAGGLEKREVGHIGALAYRAAFEAGRPFVVRFGVAERPAAEEAAASERSAELLRDTDAIIDARRAEADGLFRGRVAEHEALYRQALMSLLWSQSYYAWDGSGWQDEWAGKVDAHDVLIMPDKWEYPWLATWDTAFQAVAATEVDPQLGADQLRFILSDRWQQADGHLPCAEFVMADECPPIFAWAAWRLAEAGAGDAFLQEVYAGLKANYDYWWQTHAVEPRGLFAGSDPTATDQLGFLGMDNLPRAKGRPQADASAWMAFAARYLQRTAERLRIGEDASRYAADLETITAAVNANLWDEAQGFYFDLDEPGRGFIPTPSYSGLVPLIAGIVPADRAARILDTIRDERQFLSSAGIRSVSRGSLLYEPGYAGKFVNSNWRGPIWLPLNYLLIEAIEPLDPGLAADVRERVVRTVEADWAKTGRFHEYFDGDTGQGLGADQQTGWTALVANLIRDGWPAGP